MRISMLKSERGNFLYFAHSLHVIYLRNEIHRDARGKKCDKKNTKENGKNYSLVLVSE
jgi:hypothetical protein